MKTIFLIFLLFIFQADSASSKEAFFFLSKSAIFNNSSKNSVSDQHSLAHIQQMNKYNIKGATVYYNLTNKDNKRDHLWWVKKNYLDKEIPTNVVLILKKNDSSTFSALKEGYFDYELTSFAKQIVKYQKQFTLTVFHEVNGGWYPWGACYKDNTYEDIKIAFNKINNVLIKTGARKYINLTANFNRRGCDGSFKLGSKYLPYIEPIVDSFSISTYNRCGTSQNYKKEVSFEEDFRPAYYAISSITQKPINIGEVATSGLCGNSLIWYKNMLSSLDKYPQVMSINFFFGDVPIGSASNEIPISWRIRDKIEIEGFRSILNKFRQSKATLKKKFEYPWDLQFFATLPLEATFSPSINRFTHEPFGSKEMSILAIANQRFYRKISENISLGPGLKLTAFSSINNNQWWNNQIIPEANFSIAFKNILKSRKTLWSRIRASIYVNHNYYFVASPEDASGIGVGLRLYIGSGGDWSK